MSKPFKMKGSPFQRNFGIGRKVSTDPTSPAGAKTWPPQPTLPPDIGREGVPTGGQPTPTDPTPVRAKSPAKEEKNEWGETRDEYIQRMKDMGLRGDDMVKPQTPEPTASAAAYKSPAKEEKLPKGSVPSPTNPNPNPDDAARGWEKEDGTPQSPSKMGVKHFTRAHVHDKTSGGRGRGKKR